MTEQTRTSKSTVRNVAIFIIVTVAIGWLALGVNTVTESPSPEESLGMLIWLVVPLAVSLLLRAFAGDGWRDLGIKPAFKSNLQWYALSILVYPVCIVLILAIGGVLGVISFPGFSSDGVGLFLQLVGVGLVTNLIKNIFEEFAWRGYLTPKLKLLGVPDLANHAIVGVVWALWHLPYWIGLLEPTTLQSHTGLSLPVFILLGVVGLITSAVLFGELKLVTGSIWPPMLLHTVLNALTLPLLAEGFIAFEGAEALFTPGVGGILGTVLITLVGLWVYRSRVKGAG
jgi:membrane protease YdiL (CAAX protease family)